MEATAKLASESGVMRFKLPPKLLELFEKDPRMVIKHRPDGLMPIDTILVQHPELLQKLVASAEFKKEFEVVIMRR